MSLNIQFHLVYVSNRAVCCTRQLRIKRQLIFGEGKCSFFTISRTRLLRLESQIFFWTHVLFSLVFAHGDDEALKAWENVDLHVSKYFLRASSTLLCSKYLHALKKCCLPHTAAKDRASDFFFAGVYVFFPIGRTRLLRLERQSIFWVVYVLFSPFTAHGC